MMRKQAMIPGLMGFTLIAQAQTSETNARLREGLKRHPERQSLNGALTMVAGGDLPTAPTNGGLVRCTWMIDGTQWEALVHVPVAAAGPAPLVFAFHGHSGAMQHSVRACGIHRLWSSIHRGCPFPNAEKIKYGWNTASEKSHRDFKFQSSSSVYITKCSK